MDHRWYEDPSREPTWTKHFPVVGQGTVFFNIIRGTNFSIVIKPAGKAPAWQWVALEIYKNKAILRLGKPDSHPELLNEIEKCGVGFDADERTSYWLSFDRDHFVIKYGKGYCMVETTILQHDFLRSSENYLENKQIRKKIAYLFNPITKKVIEFYDYKQTEELTLFCSASKRAKLTWSELMGEMDEMGFHMCQPNLEANEKQTHIASVVDFENEVSFSRYPLVQNWPHLVLDSNKLSLFDLDQSEYIFSACLPSACQELYANVARAENINLDWPSITGQPKLSDAIRYSINTQGKILNKKLEEKANQFGANPNETYLRVTLGTCHGKSPGIPYVLEIWPYRHYSPIHNHGNSYAIIKVLHGSINVHVHNKKVKTHDQEPLKIVTISKGDVTWISPNWYQTHRLINDTSGDYCVTIQCYQYGDDDDRHWSYFDYVSEKNQIECFLPDSDFHFITLREKLLEEYKSYLQMNGR